MREWKPSLRNGRLALEVRCRDCDARLLEAERLTHPGAPERVIQVGVPVGTERDHRGRPLRVSFAREENGRVLLTCQRCDRTPDVTVGEIEWRLEQMMRERVGKALLRKTVRRTWRV